ncbi:MAG: hypothetical protein EOO04_18925 [Chitinophagaceae bacterium]|nr:MAG: hypothetical protein EOO04_18925 [Chitinophagaceae bacterium]
MNVNPGPSYHLEICANGFNSALAAQLGGAHRVELCENLADGGTTPSYGQVKACIEKLSIPIFPILRPRGGDFLYNDHEFDIMCSDLISFRELGCEGVVFGILLANGSVDEKRCKILRDLAGSMDCTFHRAFDMVEDMSSSLEQIISLGFTRVLTAGGGAKAIDKLEQHKNFDVEVSCQVQIGMPSEEIANNAGDQEADLIVIGMRGAGGIDKLIGSTTASVVRKAVTPVLVVPHDTLFNPITNVVFASDFSYNFSSQLFAPLHTIGKLFGCHVQVIHVQKNDSGDISAKQTAARAAISTLLGPIGHSYITIQDQSVINGIKNYVKQHQVQLVVMVAHRHSFFERLFSRASTNEMAYETRVPLLVLQDKA